MPRYRIGIDIGGTFTDLVIVDEKTGESKEYKSFSTVDELALGFKDVVNKTEVSLKDIVQISHGTTAGLNAVISRTGAKVGIITTYGFRDRIEQANAWRPREGQNDPKWVRPTVRNPLVPRYLRRTVRERVLWDGSVLTPLNEEEVINEASFLVEQGVEAIVICFINSVFNPEHETTARKLIQRQFPDIYACTSYEINPIIREYSRLITATLNAYIAGKVTGYLEELEKYLKEEKYEKDFFIMQSTGGVLTSESARDIPILTLDSGPVGGVTGARYYSELLHESELITMDTGGTSCDIAIIMNHEPHIETQHNIEWDVYVAMPVIDVKGIGAGGGSIAWMDRGGALRVGPQSGGSRPGPVCYGFGGTEPTATDAHVVRGTLVPEYFLGGEKKLNVPKAKEAVAALGKRLGLGVEETSQAIIDIQIANISQAVRESLVYRGFDPREFALFVYGSAGPMYGSAVGRELGVKKAIIPLTPGEFCAFGLLYSDLRIDFAHSVMKSITESSLEDVKEIYDNLKEKASASMKKQGIDEENITILSFFDGLYLGQTWDTLAAAPSLVGENFRQAFEENFHSAHEKLWGYKLPGWPIKLVTLRVSAFGAIEKPSLRNIAEGGKSPSEKAFARKTRVYFRQEGKYKDVPIYLRDELLCNNQIEGPAIVVQKTSTTVLNPDDKCLVDNFGNLIITW